MRFSGDIEVVGFRERSDSSHSMPDQRFEARDLELAILVERLFEISDHRMLGKFRLHRPKLRINDRIGPLRDNFRVRTDFRKREQRFVPFKHQ